VFPQPRRVSGHRGGTCGQRIGERRSRAPLVQAFPAAMGHPRRAPHPGSASPHPEHPAAGATANGGHARRPEESYPQGHRGHASRGPRLIRDPAHTSSVPSRAGLPTISELQPFPTREQYRGGHAVSFFGNTVGPRGFLIDLEIPAILVVRPTRSLKAGGLTGSTRQRRETHAICHPGNTGARHSKCDHAPAWLNAFASLPKVNHTK